VSEENRLYYGDNYEVLQRYIKDESVDLIYLDPPFNSRQDYNVLFAERDGSQSSSQIRAFKDTWEWSRESARSLEYVIEQGGKLAETMIAFRTLLGTTDMMAYIAMMAPRLVELRRVLKETGSIYLHCDPTASHYLKILMDAVFGPQSFGAEIIWKRTNARGAKANWPKLHDVLLYFRRGDSPTFKSLKVSADKLKLPHTLITAADGLKYQTYELTAPGMTKLGDSGAEWRGFDPGKFGRHWANSRSEREGWEAAGLIHWPKEQGFPRRRDSVPFDPDSRQVTLGDVWTDIDRINQAAKERLGYPTQKPEALLERILQASSEEGDLVLDPFCGCGTTVQVAQRLNRRWIGIDITHLAITLIKKRLADGFPDLDPPIKSAYQVIGEPTDLEGAGLLAAENKYQFQYWTLGLVGARPVEERKGADRGIDGRLYFHDDESGKSRQIIFSVKAGKVGVDRVRDLRGVIERERAEIGVFLCFEQPTKPMLKEAAEAQFYKSSDGSLYPRLQILTIQQLLDGRQPQYPLHRRDATFKRAPRSRPAAEETLPLPLGD
jgi:site-specific DNA-methyltransferase (adenine-specific)